MNLISKWEQNLLKKIFIISERYTKRHSHTPKIKTQKNDKASVNEVKHKICVKWQEKDERKEFFSRNGQKEPKWPYDYLKNNIIN